MTVSKTPQGRWRAKVKNGRDTVASKTFDTKRDADAWHDNQKRALTLGEYVDPRAGRVSVGDALELWMSARAGTVSGKTLREEGYTLGRLPSTFRNRPVNAVRTPDLEALYGSLMRGKSPLARTTVQRFRNTLSSFYGWCVGQGMVAVNPVLQSRVPKGTGTEESASVYPFNKAELTVVVEDIRWQITDKAAADMLLVLGLTGLRPGELIAMRVRDVQRVPYPAFIVSRSKSDGQPVKTTKSGKSRVVPLVSEVDEIVRPLLDRDPNDLLFPAPRGGFRNIANLTRATKWATLGRKRRLYDLRHTAATLWLTNGVDVKTAQAWLGHSTATLTLDTYAHWTGTNADASEVARLNAIFNVSGSAGGPPVRNLRTAK